jgi:transcriptional regulator with XRE-family HTH domain
MSDFQSMPDTISKDRYMVKRFLDSLDGYSARMREKARSDYGSRLVKARNYARLTQHALAKAVGMSQSAYAGAETTGQGSTYTSQLAAVCGVRAKWLETGEGEMLGSETETPTTRLDPDAVLGALRTLADSLRAADKPTRSAVAASFSVLASDPDQVENVIAMLGKLLPRREAARDSQDDQSTEPSIWIPGTGGMKQDEQRTEVQAPRQVKR